MIRLLNVYTLRLEESHEDNTPPYAIASHRWQNNEATFKDVLKSRNQDTSGFAKIRGFCDLIRSWNSGEPDTFTLNMRWLWIDTCCIDKKSSAELSEAINSMYNWYAEAEICVAYLFDVQIQRETTQFESSQWFDRGWTLQELIAPSTVLFVDKDWKTIGHKKSTQVASNAHVPPHVMGMQVNERIARRTGIAEQVLCDNSELDKLNVETRLSWMEGRYTTKIEDQAYCLLGIFDIHIPLIYGERQQATRRLLDEILRRHVWIERGLEKHSDDDFGTPSDTAESAQTPRGDLLCTIEALQERISILETEHGKFRRQEIARRATRMNQLTTMLQQFIDLRAQTMQENLEMQKAQAFWNPLEHEPKRHDKSI